MTMFMLISQLVNTRGTDVINIVLFLITNNYSLLKHTCTHTHLKIKMPTRFLMRRLNLEYNQVLHSLNKMYYVYKYL